MFVSLLFSILILRPENLTLNSVLYLTSFLVLQSCGGLHCLCIQSLVSHFSAVYRFSHNISFLFSVALISHDFVENRHSVANWLSVLLLYFSAFLIFVSLETFYCKNRSLIGMVVPFPCTVCLLPSTWNYFT